jgi:hypothetical protein
VLSKKTLIPSINVPQESNDPSINLDWNSQQREQVFNNTSRSSLPPIGSELRNNSMPAYTQSALNFDMSELITKLNNIINNKVKEEVKQVKENMAQNINQPNNHQNSDVRCHQTDNPNTPNLKSKRGG